MAKKFRIDGKTFLLALFFAQKCELNSIKNNEPNNNTSININDNESAATKILNNSRKNSNQPTAVSVHSQDDLNENDSSEAGSVTINDFNQNKNTESENLIQLITSLFELCIEVPIE